MIDDNNKDILDTNYVIENDHMVDVFKPAADYLRNAWDKEFVMFLERYDKDETKN